MDEDGIRLVLTRASELRSKITNCIHNSSLTVIGVKETEDKEEHDDTLWNIRDALEFFETQLSSLQALQQQQWYEKESFLVEIDYSRKRLLQKLKEYKGVDHLEVIHEATAFASSTVETENNDLILPPYPNHPSRTLASGPHFPSTHTIAQNGVKVNHTINEPQGRTHQSEARSSIKGWRQVIGSTTKTLFTLVGFIAVLSLSGFDPRVGKSDKGMSRGYQGIEDRRGMILGCPPGKVLVVENGETRCLVKARVEIPFVSVATTPDVNYGCG